MEYSEDGLGRLMDAVYESIIDEAVDEWQQDHEPAGRVHLWYVDLTGEGMIYLAYCGITVEQLPGYGHPECRQADGNWPLILVDNICPTCFRPVCEFCVRIYAAQPKI